MRHPRDPESAHIAAALFGRLAADGLLRPGEADAALAAAAANAEGVDQQGLLIRLRHAHDDARIGHERDLAREARFAVPPPPTPFIAHAAILPDAENIPPRAWLYGTRLIRRFVSVLAAPGGVGKSALAIGQALAVATGRPLLGERVHHRVPVWILNLEDPIDELDRRVAAAMRCHNVSRADLAGYLYLHSGRTRRLVMAAIDPATGQITHPDRDPVIAACRAGGIGLIIVDPFVKSHHLDENSNPHMDAATSVWADIAEATGAAILLVHHTRKGAGTDADAARGAKALTDAARAVSILAPMSVEEASALAIPARDRKRLVRLDDAKANLAPRAEAAHWYRLHSVAMGNASADYPDGDRVAAIIAWHPPSPLAALDPALCNEVLDRIALGPGDGAAFSAQRNGRAQGRWAGHVLMEHCGFEEAPAAAVIAAWMRAGLLVERAYRDPLQRKSRIGLCVIDARRPTVSTPQGETR